MRAPSLMPTDAWVRRALVPAVVFIALASDQGYLADFWHHLARGRAMTQEGALVDRDLFTFTVPGQPFLDVNWLSQLGYFSLFELGGLGLVRAVNALLMAVTLGLLVELCRRRSGSLYYSCLVGAAVFLGLWQVLTIRPQTFSLLFFVLLLHVLDRAEKNPRWLWLPPLILTLWTNMHGAFPAGLMAIGCYTVAAVWQVLSPKRKRGTDLANASGSNNGDQRLPLRQLVLCFVGSFLATLVNPYGWNIYAYVGNTSNRAAARGIDEWLPPSVDQGIGLAFFVSLAVFLLLVVYARLVARRVSEGHPSLTRRATKLSPVDWCLFSCFLPLACGSIRMTAWWLIVLAPAVTVLLASLWPQPETSRPSLGAGLAFAALLAAAVFSLPALNHVNPLLAFKNQADVEKNLDELRTELIQQRQAGRVFTRLEWGEYLSWAYAPDFPIFMDGRIEIYPDDVWQAYRTVTQGKTRWQTILDDYGVDILVLDTSFHARTGLLQAVVESPTWQHLRTRGNALLFLRRGASDYHSSRLNSKD